MLWVAEGSTAAVSMVTDCDHVSGGAVPAAIDDIVTTTRGGGSVRLRRLEAGGECACCVPVQGPATWRHRSPSHQTTAHAALFSSGVESKALPPMNTTSGSATPGGQAP